LSALGCVDATMNYARQQTLNMKSTRWAQADLDALLGEQVAALSAALVSAGYAAETLAVTHSAGLRYSGQSYEIPIPDPRLDDPAALGAQFADAHRALYGYATDEAWELATMRTEVSAPPRLRRSFAWTPQPGGAAAKSRMVTFLHGGARATPVLDRDTLPVGVTIAGPAIIEDAWSTVIVPPGDSARSDAQGNLLLRVAMAP
jgi:N-methylhydantoinase A